MSLRRLLVAVVAVSAVSFTLGRLSSSWPAEEREAAGAPSPALATWASGALTEEDLRQHAKLLQPAVRARLMQPEVRREVVEAILEKELLASEARRRGLGADMTVRLQVRTALVERLLQQEFGDAATEVAVPEEELQAYFEAHRAEYERPARLRASILFLAGSAEDGAARRVAEGRAREFSQQLAKETQEDGLAFARAVRAYSQHEVSKRSDGDLGMRTREELEAAFGQSFAAAAWAMAPGQLSGPIATDKGFFLVKVQAREAEQTVSLEQLRAHLLPLVRSEMRARKYKALLADLRAREGLRVDESRLGGVALAE
jgi:peptidyl-prolyl cis-trans isomerase C